MYTLKKLRENYKDFFISKVSDLVKNKDSLYHLGVFLEVLIEFINAGYHEEKNISKIPDWCVTFTEPIMEYFIEYFNIKTECEDIFFVDQFLTTPAFRKMITDLMAKIVSKYEFENLTPRDGIYDIVYLENAKLNLGAIGLNN